MRMSAVSPTRMPASTSARETPSPQSTTIRRPPMSSSMDVGDGPPGRIAGPPLVPRRTSRSGEVIKTAAPWAVVLVDDIQPIDTVGAEEIALRLDEVRRAAVAALGVDRTRLGAEKGGV